MPSGLLLLAVFLTVFALVLGACSSPRTTVSSPSPLPTPSGVSSANGATIDIGGYSLNIKCQGTVGPTVILDAGSGGDTETWDEVMLDMVKDSTRVCAYDRAGDGLSDARPGGPASIGLMVHELHTLLGKAEIPAPYVLVGHSWGGDVVRVFNSYYPSEMVGAVLVDAAPFGLPDSSLFDSLGAPPALDGSSVIDFQRSVEQLRSAGSFGNLPLIVISHGTRVFGRSRLEDGWARLQNTLAGLSTDSVHLDATDSGHFIPSDQPGLVAEAIRQVEAAARSDSVVAPCSGSFADLGGKCLAQ